MDRNFQKTVYAILTNFWERNSLAIYNDFVVGYESGMTMVEIAKRNNVSERTIYRYKAYYDKMREEKNNE